MQASIIDLSTNQIVNVIELEPDAIWEAPAGHIVKYIEAEIGNVFDHKIQAATKAEK
jgi:hypothetical protein